MRLPYTWHCQVSPLNHVGSLPDSGLASCPREATTAQSSLEIHCELSLYMFLLPLPDVLKVLSSVIGLLALIGIGVGVGVAVSKHNSVKSSTGGASSSSASLFSKDSRLHKSFYGIAYTPEGSLPDYGCSSTLGEYSMPFSAPLVLTLQ